MIEQLAVVERLEGTHAFVRTSVKTTCHGCAQNQHCGTGIVAKNLTPKSELLAVTADKNVAVGDTVKIGLPETSVLKASTLVYLLPLFTVLLSSVGGSLILPVIGFHHELWVLLLTVVTTAITYISVKHYLLTGAEVEFTPVLLSVERHNSNETTCFSNINPS